MSTTVPRGREEEVWGRVCGDALGWAADTRDTGMQETRHQERRTDSEASRVRTGEQRYRGKRAVCINNKLPTGWFSLTPHILTAASHFFRSRGLAGPSRADSGTRVSSQWDGCTVAPGKPTSRLVRPRYIAREVPHAKTLTWRNPKGVFLWF